jgi:hypothetical protein
MKTSELLQECINTINSHGDLEVTVSEEYCDTPLTWTQVWLEELYIGGGVKPAFRTQAELEEIAAARQKQQQAKMEEDHPEYAGKWPWS